MSKRTSTTDVQDWLESIGMQRYYEAFKNGGYHNKMKCSEINDEDLDSLGIFILHHREVIMKSCEQIKPIICKERCKLSISYLSRAEACIQVPYRADDPIEYLLVRHGESQANVDKSIYSKEADHATQLSDKGAIQSMEAGKRIRKYFEELYGEIPPTDWHCRIWTSPYKRARQTAIHLLDHSGGWITDIRESIFLGEQQFGLFEGVDWSNGEVDEIFPDELQFYNKCTTFGGRFWARLPMGESRFDVCQRVYLTMDAMQRDGIKHVIIVSHGVTLRAWLMMYLNLNPEWLEESSNPVNCSIRVVKNGKDQSYIWPQHDTKETADTENLLYTKPVGTPKCEPKEILEKKIEDRKFLNAKNEKEEHQTELVNKMKEEKKDDQDTTK